jgi:hypothetical protein
MLSKRAVALLLVYIQHMGSGSIEVDRFLGYFSKLFAFRLPSMYTRISN